MPLRAFPWAPINDASTVEHPEVSVIKTANCRSIVDSFAVIHAAPPVGASVPPPKYVMSEATTEAYEDLLITSRSVGVTEPTRIVEVSRALQTRVRRSLHYAFLVGNNQEVRDVLAKVLEENVNVLSTYMAADMNKQFVLNLSDVENSGSGLCITSHSPARWRAPVGPLPYWDPLLFP